MMWLHPALQALTFLFSLYVLWLGFVRFRIVHLGRKGVFLWKRHVALGAATMAGWLAGLGLGLFMAWLSWNMVFSSGLHAWTAMLMAPLILFGYFSGLAMDRVKKRRTYLPLAHGVNNLVLVALAASQVNTGLGLIRDFLLP